jgi:hypothetical protein
MSLDIAIEELRTRRAEEAAAEAIGSYGAWVQMKSKRAYRRRRILQWSRTKTKAWLEIAEKHEPQHRFSPLR